MVRALSISILGVLNLFLLILFFSPEFVKLDCQSHVFKKQDIILPLQS